MADLASAIREAEAALATARNEAEENKLEWYAAVKSMREALARADAAESALAREREARQAAEEEIARHPRRCTAEKKCEPCLSEERAWAETEKAEAALAEERRRREEAIIIKADLAAIPVHFVSLLPRGRIFMHPDTPKSGVRDPWPPTMPTQEAPR